MKEKTGAHPTDSSLIPGAVNSLMDKGPPWRWWAVQPRGNNTLAWPVWRLGKASEPLLPVDHATFHRPVPHPDIRRMMGTSQSGDCSTFHWLVWHCWCVAKGSEPPPPVSHGILHQPAWHAGKWWMIRNLCRLLTMIHFINLPGMQASIEWSEALPPVDKAWHTFFTCLASRQKVNIRSFSAWLLWHIPPACVTSRQVAQGQNLYHLLTMAYFTELHGIEMEGGQSESLQSGDYGMPHWLCCHVGR